MIVRFALGLLGFVVGFATLAMLPKEQSKTPAAPKPASTKEVPHPLDPLRAEEIAEAVEILRWELKLPEHVRFPTVVLHEPPKEAVLLWESDKERKFPVPRQAFVVAYDYRTNETTQAIVDLSSGKLRDHQRRKDVQPEVMGEEYDLVRRIVLADERVQNALIRRGVKREQVLVETWASGIPVDDPQGKGARLLRAVFYEGNSQEGNSYGTPIEGLMAVVDCNQRAVIEVTDLAGAPRIKAPPIRPVAPAAAGERRVLPQPPRIAPRERPGFEIQGQEVRWKAWQFRFANHPREGLVLYRVRFQEPGRSGPRSILYRASLAEMVVPYGEVDPCWRWRAAFDVGEYGFGRLSTPLQRGQEVPRNAVLLDSLFADELGGTITVPNSVALYERDGGMLWRHYDEQTDQRICRRASELVLVQMATVGNYDYGINWVFTQDGQVRVEIELTGILQVKGVKTPSCDRCKLGLNPGQVVEPKGEDRFGTLVAPNLVAVNHQHLFCFRLDLDVDGAANSVSELNVRASPSDGDNAFLVTETLLDTETHGGRNLDPASHTRWKVFSNKLNEQGHRPGFLLEPGPSPTPYLGEKSSVRQRAAFVNHNLWVTRHHPDEIYPAGLYPNQSRGGDGLPRFLNGEGLVDTDVVLWHTLGVTHVARPEEWPIMCTARTGFRLLPDAFFTWNPTWDAP